MPIASSDSIVEASVAAMHLVCGTKTQAVLWQHILSSVRKAYMLFYRLLLSCTEQILFLWSLASDVILVNSSLLLLAHSVKFLLIKVPPMCTERFII